jgi:hypothetical protein
VGVFTPYNFILAKVAIENSNDNDNEFIKPPFRYENIEEKKQKENEENIFLRLSLFSHSLLNEFIYLFIYFLSSIFPST